jgi:hypothetical protein
MSSGYVLDFSDSTFGEFVFENTGIDMNPYPSGALPLGVLPARTS